MKKPTFREIIWETRPESCRLTYNSLQSFSRGDCAFDLILNGDFRLSFLSVMTKGRSFSLKLFSNEKNSISLVFDDQMLTVNDIQSQVTFPHRLPSKIALKKIGDVIEINIDGIHVARAKLSGMLNSLLMSIAFRDEGVIDDFRFERIED